MPYKDAEKERAYQKAWYEANKEKRLSQASAWYQANKEKRLEQARAWGRANRAKRLQYEKKWRAAHPEHVKERKRAWNAKHREENYARTLAWTRANPEKKSAQGATRYARKRGAPVNDFTAGQWKALKESYHYCCAYCGKKSQRLEKDHITPLSKGGAHTLSNIVPACKSCNCRKGVKGPLKPVQPLLLVAL